MILYTTLLLSPEECRGLIEAFERHVDPAGERDFSGQPVVRLSTPGILRAAAHAVAVADGWGGGHCVETTILTRMSTGGWHSPHADNCRRDAGGDWVPNHTPNRTHTAIVYLSTPVEGGELYFPQHGVSLRPSAGQIVVFPADGEHEHGVRPLRAGVRYSLAIWLMADPTRIEAL